MKAVVAAVAHATSNKPETNVPKNYVAAMLRLDATEWKRAVLDEPLPLGKRAIGLRIIQDRKLAEKHGHRRYQARYIAQEFSQVSGVYYDLTYRYAAITRTGRE